MKVIGLAMLAAIAVSACSSAPSQDADREVAFTCANGESISVRFSPANSKAVLIRGGQGIELPQQPSGSGFVYSNGPNTIRGKGLDLTVEVGRMVPINARPGKGPLTIAGIQPHPCACARLRAQTLRRIWRSQPSDAGVFWSG
jgi:membrane-bound inhibitor of C-type lysozyme